MHQGQHPLPKSCPWYLWLDIKSPAGAMIPGVRECFAAVLKETNSGRGDIINPDTLARADASLPVWCIGTSTTQRWTFSLASSVMNKTSGWVWIEFLKTRAEAGHFTAWPSVENMLETAVLTMSSVHLQNDHYVIVSGYDSVRWDSKEISIFFAKDFLTVHVCSDHYHTPVKRVKKKYNINASALKAFCLCKCFPADPPWVSLITKPKLRGASLLATYEQSYMQRQILLTALTNDVCTWVASMCNPVLMRTLCVCVCRCCILMKSHNAQMAFPVWNKQNKTKKHYSGSFREECKVQETWPLWGRFTIYFWWMEMGVLRLPRCLLVAVRPHRLAHLFWW